MRPASIEVRTSPIAGRGLFATVDLPAGTAVARVARPMVEASVAEVGIGNHSCDPNLGWADAYTLVTMAEVPAGTELVSDYAMCTADADFLLRCHCESYRCRQMVEGTDWRIRQLQERYRGWWAPSVQGLIDGLNASPSATAARPAAPGPRPGSRPGS